MRSEFLIMTYEGLTYVPDNPDLEPSYLESVIWTRLIKFHLFEKCLHTAKVGVIKGIITSNDPKW